MWKRHGKKTWETRVAPPRITARAALGPKAALILVTPLGTGGGVVGTVAGAKWPPTTSGSHPWPYLTPSAAEA